MTQKATLITHSGGKRVSLDELALVPTPPATATWFPVGHKEVVSTVVETLGGAGFVVQKAEYALAREGGVRMFATFDLASPLNGGVSLAVGVRNSVDKSLPLGFCAGSRVFVCDNLAFSADLMVKRKHTRFGGERFQEAISLAVGRLGEFKEAEAARIHRLQETEIKDVLAESLILRAYERDVVSSLLLSQVLKEWREPSYEEFSPRTAWSLFNAFTTVMGKVNQSNPQRFAGLTMKLNGLVNEVVGLETKA